MRNSNDSIHNDTSVDKVRVTSTPVTQNDGIDDPEMSISSNDHEYGNNSLIKNGNTIKSKDTFAPKQKASHFDAKLDIRTLGDTSFNKARKRLIWDDLKPLKGFTIPKKIKPVMASPDSSFQCKEIVHAEEIVTTEINSNCKSEIALSQKDDCLVFDFENSQVLHHDDDYRNEHGTNHVSEISIEKEAEDVQPDIDENFDPDCSIQDLQIDENELKELHNIMEEKCQDTQCPSTEHVSPCDELYNSLILNNNIAHSPLKINNFDE
jgi:hypothetical protein